MEELACVINITYCSIFPLYQSTVLVPPHDFGGTLFVFIFVPPIILIVKYQADSGDNQWHQR